MEGLGHARADLTVRSFYLRSMQITKALHLSFMSILYKILLLRHQN